MDERGTEAARRLIRMKEELAGLLQNRRFLIERLTGLDENITFKKRLIDELETDALQSEADAAGAQGLRYGGLRASILERLAQEPDGMTSIEVGRMLNLRFGDAINRRSHHAILRRLEQDGMVIRDGQRWKGNG